MFHFVHSGAQWATVVPSDLSLVSEEDHLVQRRGRPLTSHSPAQDVHLLIQRAHLVVPRSYVQLERVPHVGSFLQILDVAVEATQSRGHGQHPVLQLAEVQSVELFQLVCKQQNTVEVTGQTSKYLREE